MWWLTLLGADVGRDAYVNNGPAFQEPDLITIGRRATLDDSVIIAHNFSVHNIKQDEPVEVGDEATLGYQVRSGVPYLFILRVEAISLFLCCY